MYGFKPTTQRSTESSGMVRGPGTGTSDSVTDAVLPGTYIMPADSTAQIGPARLAGLGFRPGKRKAEGEQEEAQQRGPGLGFRPGMLEAMEAARGEGPKLGFHPKGQAGGEVPVNLSNGEYKLPPEQVHAVGAQVLDAMKDATHAPARGFRPGMREPAAAQQVAPGLGFHPEMEAPPQKSRDELYFADGGLADDPNKKPPSMATSPSNTFPASQANQMPTNLYAQANADLAKGFSGAVQGVKDAASYLNNGDPVKDAAHAVGGFFSRSAEQARQPNAWDESGTRPQFAEAKPQPVQPAPAVSAKPVASSAPAEPGTPAALASANQGPATTAPAAPGGFPSKPTSAPGVTRIDEPGKAPMFTNVGPDGASMGAGSVAHGAGLGFRPGMGTPSPASGPGLGFHPGDGGSDVLGILQRESQIRAGMGPLADQIAFNEGTRGNGNYFGFRRPSGDEGGPAVLADPSVARELERQMTPAQLVDKANRAQADAADRYRTDTNAAVQRDTAAMREAGETARSAQREAGANSRAQATNEIQQAELGMKREAAGFQTAAARRLQDLQDKFMAEKDPAKRAELAQTIRDLNGREPAKPDNALAVARTNLIGELGKQYAQVQPIGDDKKPIPFETWAAPMMRAAGMGASDPRQQEGAMLKGKDGKAYQVRNGVPVPIEAAARPAPAIGEVVAGHRFRGGNPNDRANWEAVR